MSAIFAAIARNSLKKCRYLRSCTILPLFYRESTLITVYKTLNTMTLARYLKHGYRYIRGDGSVPCHQPAPSQKKRKTSFEISHIWWQISFVQNKFKRAVYTLLSSHTLILKVITNTTYFGPEIHHNNVDPIIYFFDPITFFSDWLTLSLWLNRTLQYLNPKFN
jgi:hypothetical protein